MPLLFTVTADPAALPSTLNCTVPVGVAVPLAAVTVAVNVTDWPEVDGFSEDCSVVVVEMGAALTT
jgi:hypothetical protein